MVSPSNTSLAWTCSGVIARAVGQSGHVGRRTCCAWRCRASVPVEVIADRPLFELHACLGVGVLDQKAFLQYAVPQDRALCAEHQDVDAGRGREPLEPRRKGQQARGIGRLLGAAQQHGDVEIAVGARSPRATEPNTQAATTRGSCASRVRMSFSAPSTGIRLSLLLLGRSSESPRLCLPLPDLGHHVQAQHRPAQRQAREQPQMPRAQVRVLLALRQHAAPRRHA